jgi:hypothetical protein
VTVSPTPVGVAGDSLDHGGAGLFGERMEGRQPTADALDLRE